MEKERVLTDIEKRIEEEAKQLMEKRRKRDQDRLDCFVKGIELSCWHKELRLKRKMFEIKIYPNRIHGRMEVFKDGEYLTKAHMFYEVSSDYITIFESVGGSGKGYRPGNVIEKIYIANSEIKTTTIY